MFSLLYKTYINTPLVHKENDRGGTKCRLHGDSLSAYNLLHEMWNAAHGAAQCHGNCRTGRAASDLDNHLLSGIPSCSEQDAFMEDLCHWHMSVRNRAL